MWDYDKILGCALERVYSKMQTFPLSFDGFPLPSNCSGILEWSPGRINVQDYMLHTSLLEP